MKIMSAINSIFNSVAKMTSVIEITSNVATNYLEALDKDQQDAYKVATLLNRDQLLTDAVKQLDANALIRATASDETKAKLNGIFDK